MILHKTRIFCYRTSFYTIPSTFITLPFFTFEYQMFDNLMYEIISYSVNFAVLFGIRDSINK